MEEGSLWKEWTVESLLGEGRFGKVYKLVRTEFGHTYDSALKILRIPQNESEYRSIKSEGLDEESISNYYRSVVEEIVSECSLMYELKGNSNIVSYEGHQVVELKYAFGWEIYIRMELLTPLVKHISENRMTEEDTIRLGIDICKALEICQSYKIIHRDIKPENIFISKQHNFKLGDFGIARRIEGATAGMSKKGTISYMAPEVFTNKPYNATVDTYSLGIVMYRLMNNNRTPFLPPYPEQITFSDKERADWLRMSGEPLPSPSEASCELSEIILKASSYDPKDRYRNPSEMRKDLEKLLAHEVKAADNSEETGNPEDLKTISSGVMLDDSKDLKEDTLEEPLEEDISTREIVPEEEKEAGTAEQEAAFIEEKEPLENSGNKRKKTITAIAAAILIICSIGAYSYFHHGVPTVVGEDEETALRYMDDAGLDVDITREFSDDTPKGIVLSQSIENTAVKKGTVIGVTISRGKAVTVPDVIGKSVDDATSAAESVGLLVSVSGKEYSDTVKKGRIISQDPKAGDTTEEGAEISVVKSRGIEQVEVPNVTGLSSDEAEKKLKSAKLDPQVVQNYSSNVEAGVIIGQSVDPGEKIDKNSMVTIYVSVGPAPKSSKKSGTTNNSKSKKKSNGGGNSDWSASF